MKQEEIEAIVAQAKLPEASFDRYSVAQLRAALSWLGKKADTPHGRRIQGEITKREEELKAARDWKYYFKQYGIAALLFLLGWLMMKWVPLIGR